MFPRMPGQYNPHDTEARTRDIVMRWVEGIDAITVAARYQITPEEVMVVVDSAAGKRLREEIRQRAIDFTLERFDAAAPRNLEVLVNLRDHSDDEKMQRMAALDLLEFSSLKKKSELDGNIGADLIRGIAKLAKEVAEEKEKK